jgi:nucleotide-binding universal stress UspA family protein
METLKVLIATDGSQEASVACRLLQLLSLPKGSAIHVISAIYVQPIYPEYHAAWQTMEQLFEYQREWAHETVRQTAEGLMREGIEVTTSVPTGEPADAILRAAEAFDADLVVVGSRGLTGLEAFLLGSVARSVAKRCQRPVLVARAPRNDLREVVVATDGSEHASHAVQFAARLPLPGLTQIAVVHAVQPHPGFPGVSPREHGAHEAAAAEARRKAEEIGAGVIAAAQERFNAAGRSARTELRVGDPAAEILRLTEERSADLIVCGARGVSFIEGLLMGSVADRLLRHAHCSVLIAH